MAKNKYTAALIGTGRIGFTLGYDKKREQPASHTMALKNNKRIELIAGCDYDKARLKAWHKVNKKCQVYTEASQLFACQKPDIVVIAVNEINHMDVCLEAIRAHPKLIILEKPVALNTDQGKLILDEAHIMGVPVLVNHERRFAEDYHFAKEYIQTIGNIMTINARLDSGMRVYAPEVEDTGEYSLLHDGTHIVDIVQYLLEDTKSGELNSTTPILHDMRVTSLVYDMADQNVVRNLTVNYESKLCPDVNISFSGRSKFFGFEMDIIGTEGRIKIGNGIFEFYKTAESKLYSGFYSLTKDRKAHQPLKTHYFSNMIQNAVDFLDGKSPLLSTVETGLTTLRLIEEIKEAIW